MKRAPIALTVGLIGSLLCIAGTHGQTKNQKKQLPIYGDRDGYEVLSVPLDSLSIAWKNETVRIGYRTVSPREATAIKAQCAGIPPEFQSASEDFDKKVQTGFVLRREFALKKNYELAYPGTKSGIGQPETKDEARTRIRSGIYYVAAVGFDEKKTRAIAFVEYICGDTCGDSMFYFLRKSEKGWEEAREVPPKVPTCGRIY